MKLTNLMTQNMQDPIGLGHGVPAFSYLLQSDRRGDKQTAYQIIAASSRELLEEKKADLWDSGKVRDEQNYAIAYGGLPLYSRQQVFWKARVWDSKDNPSPWSEPAFYEMGLLEEEDWKAVWIGQGDDFYGDKSAAPALAKDFILKDKNTVTKARLYISGLGLFTASVNGKPVSENLYEPGESEFNRRVYYVTYDITSFLQEGRNVIGVLLGNGQYVNFAVDPVMKKGDGTLSPRHRYQKDDTIFLKDGICGDKKLLAQIEFTRTDGTVEIAAASDESWKIGESPVTFQNWYGGEDFDGQKAQRLRGWDTPEADFTGWRNAVRMQPPKGKLSAKEFLPIRIWEHWTAESVKELPNGNWLVDMGKNSAGFVRLRLWNTGKYEGRKVEMYPAEVLKADGSGVDQASCTQSCDTLWQCAVKDSYIIAGTGTEEWHPSFCYHGFQYVEVAGFPGIPTVRNFEGCAVRLMNEKHSDFETDNEILNQINRITDRSIESNMMCSFTDCPQIEKLGWLETTQLMFSSVAAGYDIRSWIPKIMGDMRDAQVRPEDAEGVSMEADSRKYPGFAFDKFENKETEEPGFVPGIAPEFFRIGGLFKDPNWGGACVMTPWYYYREYGDVNILRQNFGLMQSYVDHLERRSVNGVLKEYAQMGEWGQLNENTPAALVATCAFYQQAVTLSGIAGILGNLQEEERYREMGKRIREGFHADAECWQPEKEIYGNGSQASYGCVLFSGIVMPEKKEMALHKLLAAVEERGCHLSSGEVGLKQVFHALASNGENDMVYRMVMNPTAPSYRHHVEQGLPTLPEFWNYTELWNGFGRSRNHAMMGHVKEWLCRFVLGIRPLEPGYKKLQIKPYLQKEITRIKGSVFTVHGTVSLDCSSHDGILEMKTEIPVGTEADIYLPFAEGKCCYLDGTEYIGYKKTQQGYIKLSAITSGTYLWSVK